MERLAIPNENGGLEIRRSLDGGLSWLPQKTLYSGNIDFYTVVWDSISKVIYLMLEAPGNTLIFTSPDEVNYLIIEFCGIHFHVGRHMVYSRAFNCAASTTLQQNNSASCWPWH